MQSRIDDGLRPAWGSGHFLFGMLSSLSEASLGIQITCWHCYPMPMAWIQQIADDEAQGVAKKIFADALRRAGRVWNIVRLTSLNGGMTRAHMGLYRSVMAADSSLEPRLRETLAVVVSQENACHY